MAVFPTTPVLDDFNRPNEGGPPSSSWRDVLGWWVQSNEFVSLPAEVFSIFNASYGPDCEAYFTIPSLPAASTIVQLYVRLTPSASTGYLLSLFFDPAGPDNMQIYRHAPGGDVAIGALVGGLALAAGDSIGLRVIGNTLTSYYKIGAGAWALQDTIVDATYPGAGYTGVDTTTADVWTIDNYGAGTIVGGAFPQAGVVDTFTRADETRLPSLGWKDMESARVVSNQCGAFALGGEGISLWNNPSIGPDCEVYATIGANPADSEFMTLFARNDITTVFGYALLWTYNVAGVDDITVFNNDSGWNSGQAQDLSPGDKFGMQLIGDTINVYIDTGAGWTLLFSDTDPAPFLSAGYLGVLFETYVGRLDSFGGGAYSSPLGGGMGTSTASSGVSHSLDTVAYVQFGDGKPVYRLGACTVIPTLPNPAPDARPAYKSVGAGGYQQIGTTPGAPGVPGLTITTLLTGAANYLEEIKERGCAFNLYVTTTACVPGTFDSWERAWVYRGCRIADDPIENARHRQDDNLITHDFSITAWNGRIDHRPVTINRIATIGTADLLSLSIASPKCPADCDTPFSSPVGHCEFVAMGAATVAAAIPDVYYTLDGGDTIAITPSEFPAGSNIVSFAIKATPDDLTAIAMRDGITGLAAGGASAIAWTWINAPVGATPGENPFKDSSLFFLDYRHGWVCTDEGQVYFSGDGGVIWTEQTTALTASSGNTLYSIHFSDALTGYAVGASDTIIVTKNGGRTWTGLASGLGEAWLSLWTFNYQRLIIGSYSIAGSGGNLFMSYDAGENWTDVTPWPVVAGVTVAYDMWFLPDNLTGYVAAGFVGSGGVVYKTINGGHDWRPIETPDNAWLQSIEACLPNQGFVVGDAHGGTSFIAKMSG